MRWVDTGREWISLPHFSYGYIPPKTPFSFTLHDIREAEKNLTAWSKRTGKRLQWRLPGEDSGKGLKVSSWLDLSTLKAKAKELPGNVGRKIRRAFKAGLIVESGSVELFRLFYEVYEKRLHQLGSAPLPLHFFKEILHLYPDNSLKADAKVYLVYNSTRRVVGGAITLFYGEFCENTWFATLPESQHPYSSYILHAQMMQDALDKGCKIYSFGRSTRGSGVHQFKKQWGTYDVELHWLRYPSPRGIDFKNFPFLLEVWKRVPLSLARPFNPYLSKHFY